MRARQSREPRTRLISTSLYSRHCCADEPGLRVLGSPRALGLSTEKQSSLQIPRAQSESNVQELPMRRDCAIAPILSYVFAISRSASLATASCV